MNTSLFPKIFKGKLLDLFEKTGFTEAYFVDEKEMKVNKS